MKFILTKVKFSFKITVTNSRLDRYGQIVEMMKQQDGKGGNLSSLDLVEAENNYDQFFEFWLPGKI